MGNAVSGAITIMITTHPFVPNFAGEVDFSPDKLGPVTTFRVHSDRCGKALRHQTRTTYPGKFWTRSDRDRDSAFLFDVRKRRYR